MGIRDPYERKWLELKMSNIEHAGEGVFLNSDVGEGVFVSIYSGFVYNREQNEIYFQTCDNNTTKSDDERKRCSKYALTLSKDSRIHIPPEYDQPGISLPTLGPKVRSRDVGHFTI